MSAGGDDALFVYGTLLDPSMRERLLGRPVEAIAARLAGYQRGRGKHFYIVRKAGAEAPGAILTGLRERDFGILDGYEEVPSLYTRERVEAIDSSGRAISCWTYLPTGWATT